MNELIHIIYHEPMSTPDSFISTMSRKELKNRQINALHKEILIDQVDIFSCKENFNKQYQRTFYEQSIMTFRNYMYITFCHDQYFKGGGVRRGVLYYMGRGISLKTRGVSPMIYGLQSHVYSIFYSFITNKISKNKPFNDL